MPEVKEPRNTEGFLQGTLRLFWHYLLVGLMFACVAALAWRAGFEWGRRAGVQDHESKH